LEILTDPLIHIRLEALYKTLAQSNSAYMDLSAECDQHFKQIQESLPEELHHTVFLYEDAQISLQSILESSIYLHGFKDALYLFNELYISSGKA
jgi:hypothetical protein